MSLDLPEKRPGDEPFESETEIEDKSSGKGVIGTLHTPVWGQYCEDDLTGMVVRGINFMSDKKKIDCAPPLYKLMHADIFRTRKDEERCAHFAARKDSWASLRWERKLQKDAEAAGAAAAAAVPVEAVAAAGEGSSVAAGAAVPSDPLSPSPCPTPASSPAGSPSAAASSASSSSSSSPAPGADGAAAPAAPVYPPAPGVYTSPTAALMTDPLAPLIIINFIIPGTSGSNMNLVLYFARRIKTAEQLRREKAARPAPASHHLAPEVVPAPVPLKRAASKDVGNGAGGPPRVVGGPIPAGQPAAYYSQSEIESDDFPHDLDRLAAFDSLLTKFLNGTDEFRDGRLKIVPRVAEGSWVVKKSIGRVPAILGKKVKQFYYRNVERNYLEIDADLGTSMVAGRIISMIKGTCRGLKVDLSFLLQGDQKGELPESLLGGIRMIHVDLDKITFLEENNKRNPPAFDF